MRLTWEASAGPIERLYQVAHTTRDAKGELGALRVEQVEAGKSGGVTPEIRLGSARGSNVFFVRACNDVGCGAWTGVAASPTALSSPQATRSSPSRVQGARAAIAEKPPEKPAALADLREPVIAPLRVGPSQALRGVAPPT